VLAKSSVNIGSDNKVDIGALEVSTYGKTKVALDSEGSVEANGKLMTTIVGGQVKLNC
jgi:hypothetical protein